MQDRYGRNVDYMRISITDRCNLRCRYCMPREGIEWLPMDQILSYEEILLVMKEAVKLGIEKYKITGGEPLVRKGCTDFIADMKKIDGVKQVTMTTNGVLLADYLDELVAAGLDAVNISLDTLDAKKYQEITRFDELGRVLASIDAASKRIPVKINAVLQNGVNESEWKALVELARNQKLDVRFIELMPIGNGKDGDRISNVELKERIKEEYGVLEEDHEIHGNGPATYCHIPGFAGSIGFISALHGKFCGSCNRIRMTASGDIKPCLCFKDCISVRQAAKEQNSEEIARILRRAIEMKPEMHRFEEADQITEAHKMAQIGG